MNADLRLDAGAGARGVAGVLAGAGRPRAGFASSAATSSSEFIRQAEIIVDAWKERRETRYEVIPGANHFTVDRSASAIRTAR